jgi:hypothetical protein
MTTPIHKRSSEKQRLSQIKFIKRGTTCDEGAKIVASSLKQDKFQAPKTLKILSQMSFYADYVLTGTTMVKWLLDLWVTGHGTLRWKGMCGYPRCF